MRLILLLLLITISSFSKSQELNLGSLSDDNPKFESHFGFLEAFDEADQIDNDSTVRFIYLRSFDEPYIFLADKDSITIKKGNKLCIDCFMVDLNRLTRKEQFLLKTFSELRNFPNDSSDLLRIFNDFTKLKDSSFIKKLMIKRINKDTIPFTYTVQKVQIKELDYIKLLFMMDSLPLQNKKGDFVYVGIEDVGEVVPWKKTFSKSGMESILLNQNSKGVIVKKLTLGLNITSSMFEFDE